MKVFLFVFLLMILCIMPVLSVDTFFRESFFSKCVILLERPLLQAMTEKYAQQARKQNLCVWVLLAIMLFAFTFQISRNVFTLDTAIILVAFLIVWMLCMMSILTLKVRAFYQKLDQAFWIRCQKKVSGTIVSMRVHPRNDAFVYITIRNEKTGEDTVDTEFLVGLKNGSCNISPVPSDTRKVLVFFNDKEVVFLAPA